MHNESNAYTGKQALEKESILTRVSNGAFRALAGVINLVKRMKESVMIKLSWRVDVIPDGQQIRLTDKEYEVSRVARDSLLGSLSAAAGLASVPPVMHYLLEISEQAVNEGVEVPTKNVLLALVPFVVGGVTFTVLKSFFDIPRRNHPNHLPDSITNEPEETKSSEDVNQ